MFKPIFAIIKPFVDPTTVQKFIVCSDLGTEALLKEIDESVLPVEYGGSNPFVVPHKAEYGGYPMRHIEYHPFKMNLSKADIAASGGDEGSSSSSGGRGGSGHTSSDGVDSTIERTQYSRSFDSTL